MVSVFVVIIWNVYSATYCDEMMNLKNSKVMQFSFITIFYNWRASIDLSFKLNFTPQSRDKVKFKLEISCYIQTQANFIQQYWTYQNYLHTSKSVFRYIFLLRCNSRSFTSGRAACNCACAEMSSLLRIYDVSDSTEYLHYMWINATSECCKCTFVNNM